MFNLNEKYFPISERCGRNHQNKFLFTSPKETFSPWELIFRDLKQNKVGDQLMVPESGGLITYSRVINELKVK